MDEAPQDQKTKKCKDVREHLCAAIVPVDPLT